MDVTLRVGWNIRRLRSLQGLTQEEFALLAGFDRGYMSGLERGVRNPSIKVLERLSNAFSVDISELFDLPSAEKFRAKARR